MVIFFINLGVIYGRVFTNGPGDRGFNPRSSHTKDSKNGT